jgi:ankyrin repeat protein
MRAVESNSPSCIKWLLEKGADPKAATHSGWQAIHLALRLGHESCVLMLLQEVGGMM